MHQNEIHFPTKIMSFNVVNEENKDNKDKMINFFELG
jgi:hypothetical protein